MHEGNDDVTMGTAIKNVIKPTIMIIIICYSGVDDVPKKNRDKITAERIVYHNRIEWISREDK